MTNKPLIQQHCVGGKLVEKVQVSNLNGRSGGWVTDVQFLVVSTGMTILIVVVKKEKFLGNGVFFCHYSIPHRNGRDSLFFLLQFPLFFNLFFTYIQFTPIKKNLLKLIGYLYFTKISITFQNYPYLKLHQCNI